MYSAQNKNAKKIASELSVKRVVSFGMVLYGYQRPIKSFFLFANSHIGISIRYRNTFYGNYFLKSNIVKIILISFN